MTVPGRRFAEAVGYAIETCGNRTWHKTDVPEIAIRLRACSYLFEHNADEEIAIATLVVGLGESLRDRSDSADWVGDTAALIDAATELYPVVPVTRTENRRHRDGRLKAIGAIRDKRLLLVLAATVIAELDLLKGVYDRHWEDAWSLLGPDRDDLLGRYDRFLSAYLDAEMGIYGAEFDHSSETTSLLGERIADQLDALDALADLSDEIIQRLVAEKAELLSAFSPMPER